MPMDGGSPQGIGILEEDSFDEFVVEQTWTVDEFIEHSGGKGIRILSRGGMRQLGRGRNPWEVPGGRGRFASQQIQGLLENGVGTLTRLGWFGRLMGAPVRSGSGVGSHWRQRGRDWDWFTGIHGGGEIRDSLALGIGC
jgi:hypothetical protein